MILEDVALLASDTPRTKSYIQMMVAENLIPGESIVYTDDIDKMECDARLFKTGGKKEYFDLNEPVLYTIQRAGIPYRVVEKKDINSEMMKNAIRVSRSNYLIYSGYGGYILKSHLFSLGKKYIHVHAGILPMYRGSTTAYYSILQDNYIGATAIFLSEGIDEGEIITSEIFKKPSNDVNIDVLYEPYLRAQVLKKALIQYKDQGELRGTVQSNDRAQTYFIIHPVLKHLALMRRT